MPDGKIPRPDGILGCEYRFLDRVEKLAEFPLMGPLHPDPELAVQGYRKLVLTKIYVAVYRVIDNVVLVYRIVNGTTNYPKLLK